MKKGYKGSIEALTIKNVQYRKVLYTAGHCQLVLMSLMPKEEIGTETHTDGDQFFRFEKGEGRVVINKSNYSVKAGDAVIVPSGATHNVINTSKTKQLKLYTLYAPPHHKNGLSRKTKKAADATPEDFDGKTSE